MDNKWTTRAVDLEKSLETELNQLEKDGYEVFEILPLEKKKLLVVARKRRKGRDEQ